MIPTLEDQNRRTGRTTQQMEAAPKGAIYVWPSDALIVPKQMARDLGRDDLEVIPESQFRIGWLERKSSPIPKVVIDHATELTADGWRAFEYVEYLL
jgi:hypothetical protein